MAQRSNGFSPVLRRALARRSNLWRDLLIALLGTAVCTAVRFSLTPALGLDNSYITFFPAVMVAGAVAGWRAALIALAACGLMVWWAFIPPPYSFALETPEEFTALCVFLLTAGLSGAFAAYLRSTLIRLWDSEDRRQLLVEELNHRVKNDMATAFALATLAARETEEVRPFLKDFAERLNAMARVNDLLVREGWDATSLSALLEQELAPLGDAVAVHGPPLRVQASVAAGLAMIVHELATNSMKHGALSGDGRVDVSWRTDPRGDGDRAVLTWVETGGPVVEQPESAPAGEGGFGSKLIARVAEKELGGSAKLDLRRDGLHAEIDFRTSMAA